MPSAAPPGWPDASSPSNSSDSAAPTAKRAARRRPNSHRISLARRAPRRTPVRAPRRCTAAVGTIDRALVARRAGGRIDRSTMERRGRFGRPRRSTAGPTQLELRAGGAAVAGWRCGGSASTGTTVGDEGSPVQGQPTGRGFCTAADRGRARSGSVLFAARRRSQRAMPASVARRRTLRCLGSRAIRRSSQRHFISSRAVGPGGLIKQLDANYFESSEA